MELNEVKFGSGHCYRHVPSGKTVIILNCCVDDGATLIAESLDEDGDTGSGDIFLTEACFLEPCADPLEPEPVEAIVARILPPVDDRVLIEREIAGHLYLANQAKGLHRRAEKAYHLEQARALGQTLGWGTNSVSSD